MATKPREPEPASPGIVFTAQEDFFADETQSQYVKGLSYTIRDGDEKLAKAHTKWLRDGRIVLGGPAARISGKG
jgi:hypothetical protein